MGNRSWYRYPFIYLLILVTLAALAFNIFQSPKATGYTESINQVLADAKNGLIDRIVVQGTGTDLRVYYKEDPETPVRAVIERGDSITRLLVAAGVDLNSVEIDVNAPNPSNWDNIIALLGTILPFIFIGAFFFFLLRRGQWSNNITQSLAQRAWQVEKPKVTFADVGGMRDAKQAVSDIVAYLKNPNKFGVLGAQMPRAALLQGPTGAGKSLFVRAVAGEAKCKLVYCNSAEFIEVFVGVGAARLRALFQQAQKLAPVVVFIDELDAVGRTRIEPNKPASNGEQQLLLSQLFVELDQLKAKRGVVVIAATNRPDLIDPALLRAGRIDRQISIALPNEGERLEILRIVTRGKSLASDVRLEEIARQTEGRSGADLAAMVNQAAVKALATNGNGRSITVRDLGL